MAGNLEVKEDTFVTTSGRTVALRIFTTKKNINKVDFALESLKKSMKYVHCMLVVAIHLSTSTHAHPHHTVLPRRHICHTAQVG